MASCDALEAGCYDLSCPWQPSGYSPHTVFNGCAAFCACWFSPGVLLYRRRVRFVCMPYQPDRRLGVVLEEAVRHGPDPLRDLLGCAPCFSVSRANFV
jgi:hypothetical protein